MLSPMHALLVVKMDQVVTNGLSKSIFRFFIAFDVVKECEDVVAPILYKYKRFIYLSIRAQCIFSRVSADNFVDLRRNKLSMQARVIEEEKRFRKGCDGAAGEIYKFVFKGCY